MPITPTTNHVPDEYPDTIRHISNGDPVNQTFLRNPCLDLEYRTEVLRQFVNALEAQFGVDISTLVSLMQNHDHSGANGEQVVDLQRAYSNGDQTEAYVSIAEDSTFSFKKSGGESAADLLKFDDAATEPKGQVVFPGSVSLHEHVAAAASDLENNPHNLRLAARMFVISQGCVVGLSSNDQTIVLNPLAAVDTEHAAPGLLGKTPASLSGTLAEGVVVGSNDPLQASPQNVVLVHQNGDLLMDGPNPIYGLLWRDTTDWKLSFYSGTSPYTFTTASGSKTLRLIGQEAYSLSTVPVVDPRFIFLAKQGIKVS